MNTSPLIYNYQVPAFSKLKEIAEACRDCRRKELPFQLRTNTLIIGPSGIGKTHLVKLVTDSIGINLLHINISEWMMLGASDRGIPHSWHTVTKFLASHRSNRAIFLDEIDKLGFQTSWDTHLRNEVFQLLDKRVPAALGTGDDESVNSDVTKARKAFPDTWIVAAGAFQDVWERRSASSLGFSHDPYSIATPDPDTLAKSLPREIINRFCSDLVVIPPLARDDYFTLLENAAAKIPSSLRNTFVKIGHLRLGEAHRLMKGARMIEEVLLESLISDPHPFRHFPEGSSAPITQEVP